MDKRFLGLGIVNGIKEPNFTYRVIAPLVILFLFISTSLKGQSPDNSPLLKLYADIKAQETNFPLPKTIEMITVGTLDLGYNKPNDIPRKVPSFDFAIEKYTDGSTYKLFKQIIPSKDFPDFTSMTLDVPNQGGTINVANIAQLNLRIAITNWDQFPPDATVVFKLGSQTQTVRKGATEVIFQNITDTSAAFSIIVNGYDMVKGVTEPFPIKGLLPFYIKWEMIGSGAITIPVLPVSITYATIAGKKINVAGADASATTTSISFTQSETAKAVPSSFQSVTAIQKRISIMGATLSKDSITMKIGASLTTIASALGSSASIQNVVATVTSPNMLILGSPAQTGLSAQGAPGAGDLICYYYNAKVLWYSENGVMTLALLGADGFAQSTADQLKTALTNLKSQPADIKDTQWHLTAGSINSLLRLDPFTQGRPGTGLDPSRFIDISREVIQTGDEPFQRTFNYAISTFNANSTAKTAVNIENDNPTFLSFLGLEATTEKTIRAQISQGASLQNSPNQQLSQTFTFNGNTDAYYSFRVYYDVVFGAFVFRGMTPQIATELSGTYYDSKKELIPNAVITLTSGNNIYSTNTDSKGHFRFSLTNSNTGILDITANNAEIKVEFKGKPVKRVKLVSTR